MTDQPARKDPAGPAAGARTCTFPDVAVQYEQHNEWLRRVAKAFFQGRRPDLADEAVALVFSHLLELVERARLTDKGERWRAYLRQAVLNRCLDLVRQEAKSKKRFPPGDPDEQRIIDHDPLGDEVATNDLADRRQAKLDAGVAGLSERQATILGQVLNGRTKKEIGEQLGISGQAVGAQLKTVIKSLHEEVTNDE